MLFCHTYETWNFYYAAISRQHKISSKIIERAIITFQNAPYTGHVGTFQTYQNVRIVEIYQRYKLSNTKYALTDVTSYIHCTWWGSERIVRVGYDDTRMLFFRSYVRIMRVLYLSYAWIKLCDAVIFLFFKTRTRTHWTRTRWCVTRK